MQIEQLLGLMAQNGASDLFVTAGVPASMKVHGQVEPLGDDALSADQAREMVFSIMNPAQREEFQRTRESNFALQSGAGRFRVNVFQQQNNVGMVVRRIETRVPTIDELELPKELKDIAMAPRGLVLVVGPTGTGKSTSLAAMVSHRNRHGRGHIVAIEDPIEFVHNPEGCIITQREVGIDTDSYEAALQNTMRQAPDVVLVGEIRSREAMAHAITFAETGHLCLATLHATNAVQTLERVVNFFPRDRRDHLLMDMSYNLRAIIAQRLIPSVDGRRRVPALEVLFNTPLVAELILRGDISAIKELMRRGTEQGMRTFNRAVYQLYAAGVISYESAIQYADSANEVRLMIKLDAGVKADELSVALDMAGLVPSPAPDDGSLIVSRSNIVGQ